MRGPQRFEPAQLSDPVIRRADGSWLYMLPSAVDDVEMRATDVLRGEDHVSNTAVQLQMFDALCAERPRFAHTALLVGPEGKLSKRLQSLTAAELRAAGIEPGALLSLLARLGTSAPVEPLTAREAMDHRVRPCDLRPRARPKFDEAELERLNAAIVHALPYEAIADRLPAGMDETAWSAIRPNLANGGRGGGLVARRHRPVRAARTAGRGSPAFVAEAARMLAWTIDPWRDLTGRLKAQTGRKGRALFQPLRRALTGRDHGPDMAELLPLIGETEARARLERAGAKR